jgi:hypothetical protein
MDERILKNKGAHKPEVTTPPEKKHDGGEMSPLANLQRTVGNRAVQRLIAQRKGDGAFALDDETAGRISSERGGGTALDPGLAAGMGQTMGHDFGDVRVHASSEADDLSQQLHAKAFTTGQDIFFREGAYNPGSGDGQKLIAHELTHVVQQSGGGTGTGLGRMSVHGPNDSFEQEADKVADQAVQKQEDDESAQLQEDDESAQLQEDDESAQLQEDDESAQLQEDDESAQLQEDDESAQLQEDEVQKQEELPDEEL